MNNYMKFAMGIAVSSMLLSSCGTDAGKTNKDNAPKAIEKANMDLSVKPGDNFFEYASGLPYCTMRVKNI